MAKKMGIKEGDVLTREFLALRRNMNRMSREEAVSVMREARREAPQGLRPEDWKINRNDPDYWG